jgi:hypothetical protein
VWVAYSAKQQAWRFARLVAFRRHKPAQSVIHFLAADISLNSLIFVTSVIFPAVSLWQMLVAMNRPSVIEKEFPNEVCEDSSFSTKYRIVDCPGYRGNSGGCTTGS